MLTKALDKILWVIEKILIALLGASIVIIALQIFFRYGLSRPLNWSEQTARCIFIWMTMLSVPCIFRARGMIVFDLLVNRLPRKLKVLADILVECIVMAFAVCFFIYSLQLCLDTGSRVMAGVKIPQNAIYVSMPIAMCILAMVILEQLIQSFKALGKGGDGK